MTFKESWQNFLTKIDNRIPIKKITGPLDKKNPLTSFFLFLLIILIVLFLIFGSSIVGEKSSYEDVTIRLADNQENVLGNFNFKIRNVTDVFTNEYTTAENGSLVVSLDFEKEYMVIVEHEEYEYFEQEIFFDGRNTFNFMLTKIEVPLTFSKLIYFEDAYTNQKISEELSVSIVCQDNQVVTSPAQKTSDGRLALEVPTSCETLIANISGENYSIDSKSISITQDTIKINRLDNTETTDVGSVNVTVLSGDDLILENSITLKLFSIDDPVNALRTVQTNFSVGFFNQVPVGEYVIKSSDLSNRYLSGSENVLVTRNQVSEVSIDLIDIKGDGPIIDPETDQEIELMQINVFLKDRDTQEIIDSSFNPTVTLLLDTNQNIEEREVHEGFVFNIDKNKNYSLKATADGYIPGEIITVSPSQVNYTFNLEKITISNVSDVIVSVRDEDEKPIVGIKAWIYDDQGQYIDPRFNFSQTDVNGIATFENIPSLDFTVRVRNSYIDETSQKFTNEPPEDTNLSIPVTIGKGTINLSLKNKLEDNISNATVTFYSETGEVLGTSMTSTQGTLQNQVKADKRVFLHIESDGYLPYFTELFRIYKDKTKNLDLVLERPLETSQVVTEYLGLYNTDMQKVESLKNNQVFYLKYKVIMPSGTSGFNFALRAGSYQDVKDDITYILSENNSLGIATYYDKEPFTVSGNFLESKLVNLQFINYPASVHEVTIPIRIENAKINDSVSFFYTSSNSSINFNQDNFTQLQYFVEATSLCNETFCFSGQYVDVLDDLRYDIGNNRLVPMQVNSEYLLEYFITNSSQTNFPTARLSVTNVNNQDNPTNMVRINEYDVYGEFSSIGFSSIDNPYFKIPFNQNELLSDNIGAFTKINFDMEVFPLIVGQSKLLNRIASDQAVIYSLPINFAVTELDNMNIDYEPKNIVPGVPFILTVTVKDDSGDYVSGANINVLQKVNNSLVSVSTGKTTDDEGKVLISLPALKNNETFVIEAIKSKYYAEPLEFSISENILDVMHENIILTDQEPLNVSIHKMDMDGSEYTLTLRNKTDYPLTLKEFSNQDFSFNRADLLNLGQSLNFLNNQISSDFIIPENGTKDLKIKFSPSESARTLPVTQDILGVISGSYFLNNIEQTFSIPVKTKLSVGLGVLEDNCLVVSQGVGEWNTVVSQASQTISLDVINTCISKEGEQPVSIKNLQAKITSQGDRYGVYLLNVVGPNGSQIQLTENSYRTVVNEMLPGQEYRIDITFNPNGVKFADIKSEIYLNAQIETENGLEYVNKSPHDILVKTNISVMDLSECFTYIDNFGKTINSGGLFVLEDSEFNNLTIQNNCLGKANFKMDLCEGNDYGCRDLIIENTDQENNIINFSLNEAQKSVDIKRDSTKAPGAYILNNKVSVVNNFGRDIATSFVLLKVNAKDPNGLWMDDPFIEISENKESQIVRLYNNDLEKTIWHYLSDPHDDFVSEKYVEDPSSYVTHEARNFTENIKYILLDTKQDSKEICFFDVCGLENLLIGSIFLDLVFFAGGSTILLILVDSFTNTYDIDDTQHYFELDSNYSLSNLKEISINDLESEKSFISILDMTGIENFSFYKSTSHVKGALIKKKKFTNVLSDCPASQELVLVHENIERHRGCSSSSDIEVKNDGSHEFSVECSGAWPKNKIDLVHSAYLVCKNNAESWPEQAGVKPIKFDINDSFYEDLYQISRKYNFKEIDFKPTLNIDNFNPEEYFGSSNIGKYRYSFFLSKPEESPNYDLGVLDCVTDTGKIGKTGVGAVPNISLDWDWKLKEIDKCTETYCDATQFTQEVLSRIDMAKELISSNNVSCPISFEDVVNQSLEGTYIVSGDKLRVDNDIPVLKSGIDRLRIDTIEDELKIKVTIENRDVILQNGSLYLNLDGVNIKKIEVFNNSLESFQEVLPSNTISVSVESQDLLDIIYTFDSFEFNNKNLNILFNAPNSSQVHSTYNNLISLEEYNYSPSIDCSTLPTTMKINGINYTDFWLNKEMYPNQATSNWSQEDILKLKNLLEFDAYLITDRYNQNFINDFDMAYGGLASKQDGSGTGSQALISSPAVFSDGYLSKLFKNNLTFIKQYSNENNNVNVNVPGKYRVVIDFVFGNSSWNFERNQDVDVKANVTLRFVSSPETDSVFYRLPFNGFVGQRTGGYERQGYGVSYFGDDIRVSGTDIITGADLGSNAYRRLTINQVNDLSIINSSFETRGNVLSLSYNNQDIDLTLSPSRAIPVLMEVKKNNTSPLNVFYRLKDKSDNVLTNSSSLFRWTGVGSGCDFSGTSLYNMVYYDRYSQGNGPQGTYVVDWPQVTRQGDVYFRSIFYAPDRESYTLENRSDQGVNVKFLLNGNSYSDNVFLDGSSNSDVTSLKSVFDLVRDNKICVVNSSDGSSSQFFYNPAEIYSEKFLEPPSNALECS